MRRDLLDLIPRPLGLLERLRKIAFSGALAALGVLTGPTFASGSAQKAETDVQAATSVSIVDRSRKAAKLVLRLPGAFSNLIAQHRSHSSHSSHRSHSSHSSHSSGAGRTVAPPPPPARIAPPPAPRASAPATAPTAEKVPAAAAASLVALADFGALQWYEGTVEGVDRQARTIRIRARNPESRYTVGVKDDTMYEIARGVRMRWDDYVETRPYPLNVGDTIQFSYRQNAQSKAISAVVIVRAK